MNANKDDIMKVTQAEGIFYYNSQSTDYYSQGRLRDGLYSNLIHDFTVISRSEVPAGEEIRSEDELREVLAHKPEEPDFVLFEVTLNDQTQRYFQVPPHQVGMSSHVLRDACEDDMIIEFRRVSESDLPPHGKYECGWERYDAFRLLMAELFLGLTQ